MNEPPQVELDELLRRVRRGAISDSELEALMGHPSVELRREASARAARSLRPERLLALLLQDQNFARRESAGDALVKVGDHALVLLSAVAKSADSHSAMIGVQVIARMDAPGVLPLLRELAEHPDALRSQAALEGLCRKRDRESIATFLKVMTLEPWRAFTAAVALGELADPSVVPALKKLRALPDVGELVEELIGRLEQGESRHG